VPQNLIRKPSHLKKSGHFSNLEKKNLCVKKKFCNQNLKKKSKSCSPGLVCITELQKNTTIQNLDFSWPFFLPVFVFVKTKKFPFQMSKYKKKKKNSHAYISEKKKNK
jgi:hypothetical protein